jgi:hypothetical protein
MLTPTLMTHQRDKRTQASIYAQLFVGLPYLWGGDDPMGGFDCSGLVCEVLQSVGILKHGSDFTAEMLYQKFKKNLRAEPSEGCLVFWGAPKKTHIEMVIFKNDTLCQLIGASGGGSATTNLEMAKKSNAYVKIRPLDQKPGWTAIVDPFA